jgi:hypothetical protein
VGNLPGSNHFTQQIDGNLAKTSILETHQNHPQPPIGFF